MNGRWGGFGGFGGKRATPAANGSGAPNPMMGMMAMMSSMIDGNADPDDVINNMAGQMNGAPPEMQHMFGMLKKAVAQKRTASSVRREAAPIRTNGQAQENVAQPMDGNAVLVAFAPRLAAAEAALLRTQKENDRLRSELDKQHEHVVAMTDKLNDNTDILAVYEKKLADQTAYISTTLKAQDEFNALLRSKLGDLLK